MRGQTAKWQYLITTEGEEAGVISDFLHLPCSQALCKSHAVHDELHTIASAMSLCWEPNRSARHQGGKDTHHLTGPGTITGFLMP